MRLRLPYLCGRSFFGVPSFNSNGVSNLVCDANASGTGPKDDHSHSSEFQLTYM